MNNSHKLFIRSNQLYPHPLLDRAGILPDLIERETKKGKRSGDNREDHKARALELDAEFIALVDDILLRGIDIPLKVSKGLTNWLIADGRNRWEAAKYLLDADPLAERWHGRQALLEEFQASVAKGGLPCIEIQEEEVPATILSAMTRRHMTKQARALMAIKIFPEVAESTTAGRPKKFPAERGIITQIELAAKIGVGVTTMEEACLFWRKIKLEFKPDRQAELINEVLAGISFENALIGEKGRAATAGKPRQQTKVWTIMSRNANSMKNLWKDFEKEKPETQTDITERLVDALKSAPAGVKNAIKVALEGGRK